jgi:hypothetical protein
MNSPLSKNLEIQLYDTICDKDNNRISITVFVRKENTTKDTPDDQYFDKEKTREVVAYILAAINGFETVENKLEKIREAANKWSVLRNDQILAILDEEQK